MKTQQWNSQFGFIVSAIATSIGLGSIWRFPYLTYENGGATFILAYVIGIATLGIPLLILEFGLGKMHQTGAPGVFKKIHPSWEWLGWWPCFFIFFGIYLYYNLLISWCLAYFKYSFSLEWGSHVLDFFQKDFLNQSSAPSEIHGIQWHIAAYLSLIFLCNWFVVHRGLNKGLEKINKIFMLLLFSVITILFFWSFTLEGAEIGLRLYFNVNLADFFKIDLWFDALGQVFYSLSIGFGIMILFSGFLPQNSNVTKAAIHTTVATVLFSIFAGCVIFNVLGFMSHSSGIKIQELIQESIALSFLTYPEALNQMALDFSPFVAKVFGGLFFFSLVIAGISSSGSLLETICDNVTTKFPDIPKQKFRTRLTICTYFLSLIFATDAGIFIMDIIDHYVTSYGLLTAGLLQCLLAAWVGNIYAVRDNINLNSFPKVGNLWVWNMRYCTPILLLGLLGQKIYFTINYGYSSYSTEALAFFGILPIALSLIVSIAMQKIQISKQ